jgi:hypothetical protein
MNFRQSTGHALMKHFIWSVASYGAENWILQKVDQKYRERFKMRCWRRMEMIMWTEKLSIAESRRKGTSNMQQTKGG